MKRALPIIILVIGSMTLTAQNNELEMFNSIFNLEKKAALADYLNLTEEESPLFWKIYDEYSAERKVIMNESFDILQEYAKVYEDITDEQAEDLMKRSLQNRMDFEKLQKKYFKKVSKSLGGTRATQFVMFETYVDVQVRSELYNNIPFIVKS